MSAVYRAYDTVMGREVALKRLLPVEETNLNEAAAESLSREVAALSRFQHPNVITVFAFEEDAVGPYVVMELLEGDDLHAVVKAGALSWENFRDVAGQCLEPLVAAGELNLLHRDIKPGNIMLTVTPSGRFLAKLLDFGLAKFSQQPSLQTLDQRGSFLGSIEFIAPEQLELRPLDQRTDLYSLGCVFYYMLAQKSPFAGDNPAETSVNHIKHRCTPIGELRDDLPPLVADWIMRLVSRYPEDRPANAREALKQFQDALRGIPYVAPSIFDDDKDIPFLSDAKDSSSASAGTVQSSKAETTEAKPPPSAGKQMFIPPITKSPQRGVPARPSYQAVAALARRARQSVPRSPAPGKRPPRWLVVASAAVLAGALALGWLLSRKGGDEESEAKERKTAARGDADEAAENAYPARLALSAGLPPVPVPVEDGLFAHFVASQGVYGRSYRGAPAEGEVVAAWVNLASEEVERFLLRDEESGRKGRLPRYRRYGSVELPGLRGEPMGVETTSRSFLTMLRHPGVLPRGFTLVAALNVGLADGRLFLVEPPVEDGRFVSLEADSSGRIAAIHRDQPGAPESRIEIPWAAGRPGVLAYVWDPDGREHRLLSQPAGVGEGASAAGPIAFEGAALGRIAIGPRKDEGGAAVGSNAYFEFLVYDRVLDASELRSVVDDLASRYFGSQP